MFYPTVEDEQWMRRALDEARKAVPSGDVPVGAVVVQERRVIGQGCNRREADADPTAHAELVAIRHAAKTLGCWNLTGATLYVTVEPCPMCAGAIWMARVSRVVYGVSEPKTGAVHSRYELLSDGRLGRTVLSAGECLADEARLLLEQFFEAHRLTDTEPF